MTTEQVEAEEPKKQFKCLVCSKPGTTKLCTVHGLEFLQWSLTQLALSMGILDISELLPELREQFKDIDPMEAMAFVFAAQKRKRMGL